MTIKIDSHKQIATIQDEFNAIFPYLKLEFFSIPHKTGTGSAKKFIIPNTRNIGEFNNFQSSKKNIIITPQMTVKDLEENFHSLYGLSVQVFRKSGKVWLETTVTDNWTLEEQNAQGEALSKQAG